MTASGPEYLFIHLPGLSFTQRELQRQKSPTKENRELNFNRPICSIRPSAIYRISRLFFNTPTKSGDHDPKRTPRLVKMVCHQKTFLVHTSPPPRLSPSRFIYIYIYISTLTVLTNPTHRQTHRQRSSTSNRCSSSFSSSSAHPHTCTHYFPVPWTGIRMGKSLFLPFLSGHFALSFGSHPKRPSATSPFPLSVDLHFNE